MGDDSRGVTAALDDVSGGGFAEFDGGYGDGDRTGKRYVILSEGTDDVTDGRSPVGGGETGGSVGVLRGVGRAAIDRWRLQPLGDADGHFAAGGNDAQRNLQRLSNPGEGGSSPREVIQY